MTTSKLPSLKDPINSRLPQWLKVGELLITFYPHSSNTDHLDRIANEKVRPWAQLSVHIFRLLMLATTSLLIYTMYSSLMSSQGPTAANAPKNTLLIPGVNDFIPMVAAPFVIVSVFVAVAAHELAHAVVGRIEGATIEEYGAAFLDQSLSAHTSDLLMKDSPTSITQPSGGCSQLVLEPMSLSLWDRHVSYSSRVSPLKPLLPCTSRPLPELPRQLLMRS